MDNMTIFDFIENEHKFAPIIDRLSADISRIFSNHEYTEEYKIWEHVPNLGYRYSAFITILEREYNQIVSECEKMKSEYEKDNLEVSILQSPSVKANSLTIFISTLWKDKKRAKNG